MGSFNIRCSITDINIQWGEPCQIFRLKPNKYPEGYFYPHSRFVPDSFPVSAKYYNYGYFDEVEEKPVNRIFDPLDTSADYDVADDFVYFACHKVIYDQLASRIQSDYEHDQEIWIGGERKKNSVEAWQGLIDKFLERSRRFEEMMTKIKESPKEDYKSIRDSYPSDVYLSFMSEDFRRTPLHHKVHEIEADYWREPTLAKELFEWNNFHVNVSFLNKNFVPANYASQEDNAFIYDKILIPFMQEVCYQKKRRWGEDD